MNRNRKRATDQECNRNWVVLDVAGIPRDRSAPLPKEQVAAPGMVFLTKTLNKTWRSEGPVLTDGKMQDPNSGVVRMKKFRTWNNLDTNFDGSNAQYVQAVDCAP